MAFKVLLTEDAERDVEDIHPYIARSDSLTRADRVLDALEGVCNALSELPDRGNVPDKLRDLGIAQYREVRDGPYRIVYQIIGDATVIHCVLDGRRDMASLLHRRLIR